MISFVIVVLCAYLLGSFPSAWIAGKCAGGSDIRQQGSGNAGATNVLRVFGTGWALIVLCADSAKGVLAILLAGYFFPVTGEGPLAAALTPELVERAIFLREPALGIAGLFAVIGHVFPLFLGFHGGKGVATAAGVITALFPPIAPVCAGVFVLVLVIGRKASLASIVTAVTLPLVYALISAAVFDRFSFWILGVCVSITFFLVGTHRENIKRLREGSEPDVSVN